MKNKIQNIVNFETCENCDIFYTENNKPNREEFLKPFNGLGGNPPSPRLRMEVEIFSAKIVIFHSKTLFGPFSTDFGFTD